MTTATQRIPVLVTTNEKLRIAKMAKDTGLSMGEFLRRAATSFNPSQDDAHLENMIVQMVKTTKAANQALDEALLYVERSNKRIATMEAKHHLKAA